MSELNLLSPLHSLRIPPDGFVENARAFFSGRKRRLSRDAVHLLPRQIGVKNFFNHRVNAHSPTRVCFLAECGCANTRQTAGQR